MYKLCPIDLDSCKVAHLEINQEIDDRSTSPYGVQQKLCRDFLSTFSRYGILVAPQRSLKEIMAVGRSDCFSDATINFEAWLSKQAVTIKAINRADCLSVEECVRFAIVVWLESHRYYRCGSDLIKGPFLGAAASSKHTKIVFTVHCTSVGEVIIRVSSETVRLLPLTTAASQLLRGRSTEEHRWVFCLPRLGRGQLVAQYRRIPDDSAFANYSEMRAYWKNCHGYDLPLEEPETYYDVLFRGFRSAFLYPDFCVLSSEPVPVHFREDYVTSAAAINDFLLVFASRKHFICMEEVKLSMVDPNIIGFCGRSLRSLSYKSRTSSATRALLPRSFTSSPLKKDVQMEDSAMRLASGDLKDQAKEIAVSRKAVNYRAKESFVTPHLQHGNVAKTIRDRKRLIDVD